MSRYLLFAALLGALGLAGAATTFAAEARRIFKFYCARCHAMGSLARVTVPTSPRTSRSRRAISPPPPR